MSAKKKPIRAWAMTAVDGKFILEHTIRRTRKQVIEDDERLEGTPWKEWRKAGCRIIRVIITPEPFP